MKTLLTAIITLIIPSIASAQQQYSVLVGIPGVTNVNTDFSGYINALYILSISIAALLAVIKIIIGGVKWMLTDIVTSKSNAKNEIQGALVGLLVVLSAVLILTVINPALTNTTVNFSKTGNTSITGANPTAPAPAPTNAAQFDYQDLTQMTGKQLNSYAQNCLSQNKKYVNDARTQTARCYTITNSKQNITKTTICDLKLNTAGCTPTHINNAQSHCQTNLNGTYSIDPLDTNYYICIH